MKLRILIALGCCMAATALADDPKAAFDAGNYADTAKQLEPKLETAPSAEGYYNSGLRTKRPAKPRRRRWITNGRCGSIRD